MKNNTEGGPAFPCGDFGQVQPHPGMTLRDYFAIRIMASLYCAPTLIKDKGETVSTGDHYARVSYELAEALLIARELPQKESDG